MNTYYAAFIPSDGVWGALFPDFPGCNAQGATLEEARALAADALFGHIGAEADKAPFTHVPLGPTEALRKAREIYDALDLGDWPADAQILPLDASACGNLPEDRRYHDHLWHPERPGILTVPLVDGKLNQVTYRNIERQASV